MTKKLKIAGIRPGTLINKLTTTVSPSLPIGLAYTLAAIKDLDVDIIAIDGFGESPFIKKAKKFSERNIIIGLDNNEIVSRLEKFDPDVIILASNTPSLLFREKLPNNVITILPPLEKIQKASNVAILTTEIIAKSKELDDYIEQFDGLKEILKINCSELVELVESGKFLTHERDCVKTILKVLKDEFKENKIEIATLSSTHLPFLLPFLKKNFRGVKFLDPAEDIAKKISKLEGTKSKRNSLSIYTTKSPKALQRNLKSIGISNKVNLFS